MAEPLVRFPVLSAALGRAEQSIYREILRGAIPRHDHLIPLKHSQGRVWRLSTLRAWNPQVADRCAAILTALESLPRDAA